MQRTGDIMMSSGHPKSLLFMLLVLKLCSIHTSAGGNTNTTVTCLPSDASALLRLKRSFLNSTNLTSWQAGTDCCRWEGIVCDTTTGLVIVLDLSMCDVKSRGLDPALFNLTSLRNLSLASSDFMGASMPPVGFELLTELVHLDLSNSGFIGQVPIGIAQLTKLVTLNLSITYYTSNLVLKEPNFQTFIANLNSLQELSLDGVDISSSGETWSIALANATPRLQILTLSYCGLSGSIHSSFSQLHSLAKIDLTGNTIVGKVPEFFVDFPLLSELDLTSNDFEGLFPARIFQHSHLRILSVADNPKLSGHLPKFPVENKLEQLILVGTNFSDAVPESIVNLRSLSVLVLSTDGTSKKLSLFGELPSLEVLMLQGSSGLEKPGFSWIGNLRHLTTLEIYNYNFSEPIPSWIGNLTNLVSLELIMCNFYGVIPPWIGNLTQLSFIHFGQNYLTGKIPRSLFALPELQQLRLLSNQLSGHLEEIETPLSSSISFIELTDNQIGGSIPQSYFQLTSLEGLFLGSNKLTGTVDLSSFWRLKNLFSLILSNNMLSLIDEEGDSLFPSLPPIQVLFLSSCNLTKLPSVLRYLNEITDLDLSSNQINGVIPSWVWENWNGHLTYLNLSHNMFTSLEKSPSLVPMGSIYILDLSYNRLEGDVPIPIIRSGRTDIILDYSNNYFNSILPSVGRYLGKTSYLDLSSNKIRGHIPTSICNASELQILDLSHNYFSGVIPSCLAQRKLGVLKLRGNQVHGELSDGIREGCMLETIDLSHNYISGKLPRSLSNCRDLGLLDISNNQISDSFPSWLGMLPKLQILVLRSNKFSGLITDLQDNDQIMNHFSSLQILDLASNQFSGNLPKEWFNELESMKENGNDDGQVVGHQINAEVGFYQDDITITYKESNLIFTKILTTFKVIDLSNNSFVGHIPESIGSLVSLHGLNMSYNNFMGQIPSQLGNLTRLESMDLSWNHLSGEIPQQLTSLTSLSWLNLSYNNLTGRIPQGNQFLSFPSASFEGNAGLCGNPLSTQCDGPDPTTPTISQEPIGLWQDRLEAILLLTFSGLGFGVGFTLAIMFRRFCHIEGWVGKAFLYLL